MLTYAILLLVLGIVLLILEAFLPSGGILGLMAGAALVGSLILAFRQSDATGFTFVGISVVIVPVAIVLSLKVFPKTPVGRRVILRPPTNSAEAAPAGVAEEDYSVLLGRDGKTVTPLRPSGIIEIEGRRYSAVADGEMIAQDMDIIVITVEGNNIVVDDTTNA